MVNYRNSGWEFVNLIVFVLVCASMVAMVRELGHRGWLRLFRPVAGVLRILRLSLFRYRAVTFLFVCCVLAGLGLVLHDFGVKSWLFPDAWWGRFFTGALLLMLYGEVVLLSYICDQEVYRYRIANEPTAAMGSAEYLRTRRVLRDTRRWLQRPDRWMRRIMGTGVVHLGRVDAAVRQSPVGAARQWTAEQLQAADLARLGAAPTVVLVNAWYACLAIAVVAASVVVMENFAYLGSVSGVIALVANLAGYVMGLFVGWGIIAGVLGLADWAVRRWLAVGQPASWPLPSGTGLVVGVSAVLFMILGILAPDWRMLWAVLAIPGGLGVVWLLRWRGLSWGQAVRGDGYWTYPAVMALILAVASVVASCSRRLHFSEEPAWLLCVIAGVAWTVLYARRTRLLVPGSLVTIPASFLLLYMAVCISYGGYVQGLGISSLWRVVALPLTCFLGASFALYFLLRTMLPRSYPLGILGILAMFAYMDGMAVDGPRSEQKLSFPDLRVYDARPVLLDSRDYLLSSYGVVVTLDEQRVESMRPPLTTRIGGGRFVVSGDASGDLYVGLPSGYLVPELLSRPSYRVVLRMPRRVRIEREKGASGFVIPQGESVSWQNLQSSALLWAIPRQKAGLGLQPSENLGRYAVFPLRSARESVALADRTPYWKYKELVSDKLDSGWRISPPDVVAADGVDPEHLYLIGNWEFPIEPLRQEDLSVPSEMVELEKQDRDYRVAWFRLRGAAQSPYYPRLWWRPLASGEADTQGNEGIVRWIRTWWQSPDEKEERTQPDRPDAPGEGKIGLCLNLAKPAVGGVTLQDDLEVSLALPRPWGKGRWLGWTPGPGATRYWVLATMVNGWVMPEVGDLLRFTEAARSLEEGGLSSDRPYRVVSLLRPEVDSAIGKVEGAKWGDKNEEAEPRLILFEPKAGKHTSGKESAQGVDGPVRVAVVLGLEEESVGTGSGRLRGAGREARVFAPSTRRVTPKLWEQEEVLSWSLEQPEKVGVEGALENPLLDQVRVLDRWKEVLDGLRPRATPAGTEESWRCRCPVEHTPACTTCGDRSCDCPVEHTPACTTGDAVRCDCPVKHKPACTTCGDRSCDCPVKHKLVVVTANGGGIRSALWTVTVLESLERQFGPTFPYHVRLITGASGGMVGASYYAESIPSPPQGSSAMRPHPRGLAEKLARCDFFTPTANHLVFSDLPRLIGSPVSVPTDRGVALEQAWRGVDEIASRGFGKSFARLREEEARGWRPSLVFTPMIVEDGRRLLVSNLDFNAVPRNMGGMLLEPSSSLLRPQMGQLGVCLPQAAAPGEDLYSLTSVEFFRLFPAADNLTVGAAARMSATFPLISPSATLPTLPARSVVDAGYYDNFGVNLVSLWAKLGSVQDWLVRNTSGVVIVQIRDHSSQTLRTELDADRRQLRDAMLWDGSGATLAALTGDAFEAVGSRGVLQLTRPLNGYFNSRYAVTTFRNDEQIEDLDNTLNIVPMTPRELRAKLQKAVREVSEEKIPLKVLPDLVQLQTTGFPYATVVFECPVEAVLSWDLSNFEAENIRMGMGPLFSAENDRTRPPLSLLNFDPLSDAQRRDLLAFLNEELTQGESKRYGPMVGASRIVAVAGVWRNLQRLKLLDSWWGDALPTR